MHGWDIEMKSLTSFMLTLIKKTISFICLVVYMIVYHSWELQWLEMSRNMAAKFIFTDVIKHQSYSEQK